MTSVMNMKTRMKENNDPLTAPTQKAGFRVPKTDLWFMKLLYF